MFGPDLHLLCAKDAFGPFVFHVFASGLGADTNGARFRDEGLDGLAAAFECEGDEQGGYQQEGDENPEAHEFGADGKRHAALGSRKHTKIRVFIGLGLIFVLGRGFKIEWQTRMRDGLKIASKGVSLQFLMSSNAAPAAKKTKAIPGKYLTFVLGHEAYGMPVLKVREIIRMCELTAVPDMPDFVKGVINLRGRIIPAMDLRLKFRLGGVENTDHTCIVVSDVFLKGEHLVQMGLIVDSVEEVVTIAQADIEPTPDFGSTLHPDYILGMAKVKGRVKGLLDIDRLVMGISPEQLGVR